MEKKYSLSILRAFCTTQVFILHYLAYINLRDYIWMFKVAVPVFLLISSYIYGLKRETKSIEAIPFLKKRWKTLSVSYYPFLLVVYVFYAFYQNDNVIQYSISFVGDLLFATKFVSYLPKCGHLWFLQVLMMCYITLALVNKNKFIEEWFTSKVKSITLFALMLMCGFVYRGYDLVYLFFYIWLYFNAINLTEKVSKINNYWLFLMIVLGYLLMSFKYYDYFQMGIYLYYNQLCIMAIITIFFFGKLFKNASEVKLVNLINSISIEFYLVHHLLVFDQPLYISLPSSIIFSVILKFIATRLSFVFLPKKAIL